MGYLLKVLDSLDEVNLLQSGQNSKVNLFKINSNSYGLLIFNLKNCRISFVKLIVNFACFNIDSQEINWDKIIDEKEAYKIYLLNVFCLPFPLLDVVCTCHNVWALGYETAIDLKPYIESALKKGKSESMDTDEIEEFSSSIFDINVNIHKVQTYNFHIADVFLGLDFIDFGLIKCSEDLSNDVWHLDIIVFSDRTRSFNKNNIRIFDIPKSFDKSVATLTFEDQSESYIPTFVFINYNETQSQILQKIFGISYTSSSAVCLVGHPDGSLLWTLFDKVKFNSVSELQHLYSIKQPVIGIHFVQGTGEYADCDFMIAVGALGQLTFFSPRMLPSFSVISGEHPFWVSTFHLKSSIKNSAVIQNCLLHTTYDGTLSVTDISTLLNLSADVSCAATKPSDLCNINKMVVIDKNKGLVLLKSNPGNVYLAVCSKESDSRVSTLSLPSLLNECLQQSVKMQELLKIKALQGRLFTALSTFASLKFGVTVPEMLTFSITEVNVLPKKYILMISLKFLEKLSLDPELCRISASLFTYFRSGQRLVSKTVPYNPDQKTFCVEIISTDLQPLSVTIFPLFVEIGIILQLPEHWKTINAFRTVSCCLPFYLCVETFMVHELHLFQSGTIFTPQSSSCKMPLTSFDTIKYLGAKRPISNLVQFAVKKDLSFPVEFNLCLSLSSVDDIMKQNGDDICKFIQQLLSGKKGSNEANEENYVTSENCSLSASVSKRDNSLMINLTADTFESLVGLRIAVLQILLSSKLEKNSCAKLPTYVNIPASLYRRCEEIYRSVMNLYGKDIDSIEVTDIIKLYQELRKDVSGKLPLL